MTPTLLGLTAKFSFAYNPHDYYDWSTPQILKQTKVLADTDVNYGLIGDSTESISSPNITPKNFDRYLFFKNAGPDNPLHFIKLAQENIQLALSLNPSSKAQLRLKIAAERLNELQQLINEGKTESVEKLLTQYKHKLTGLTDQLKDLDDPELLNILEEESVKHNMFLEQTLLSASDEILETIKDGLLATNLVGDTLADSQNKPAIPSELTSRLLDMKTQGLLSPEEVNKIINLNSRVDVRKELNKYRKSGIFPEADFKKLDDHVYQRFPTHYLKTIESKKFFEMQKLEDQKPDDDTLQQVKQFAQNYQPGDTIPSHLRDTWYQVVRLEEIQNTFRPDLVDFQKFEKNDNRKAKFEEFVGRFQPQVEDVNKLEQYEKDNPNQPLPKEYERIKAINSKFGTTCDAGSHWQSDSSKPQGGFCTTSDSLEKNPEPVIYQPKWCPSNTHWVDLPQSDGYCAPNITYPSSYNSDQKPNLKPLENIPPSPSTTFTPGDYPSPIYSPKASYPEKVSRTRSTPSPTPTPKPTLSPVTKPPSGQGTCPTGSSWTGSYCYFPSPDEGGPSSPPPPNNQPSTPASPTPKSSTPKPPRIPRPPQPLN